MVYQEIQIPPGKHQGFPRLLMFFGTVLVLYEAMVSPAIPPDPVKHTVGLPCQDVVSTVDFRLRTIPKEN
jgi:hypothetical protein